MTIKLCHKLLHTGLFILSLFSLWLKTTTSTSFGHQLVPVAASSRYKCIDKERYILLDFKTHLQDPRGHLSTWKLENEEDGECCNWYLVMCDIQTGHVTQLDLSYLGLEGKITPSLFNLTHLTRLDLSHNSLTKTIPSSIGSLTKLTYLDLSFNSFSGTVPTSIGFLNELAIFDLSGNHLLNGSCIPQELGNLTNLHSLSLRYLESCTIENIDWTSHMFNLNNLAMDGTSLAKANNWVNVIVSLPKLFSLSLARCELSQVMHTYSSSFVNRSSSIIVLDLSYNNLNSSTYHWLLPLTSSKLLTLDLSRNMLDGISLGNLCNLTSLYFNNNTAVVKFSDFLNNWSGCQAVALEYLNASQSQIRGSLSDEIQICSSLEFLYLDHNELNGSISEKVWALPKLQGLGISSNYLTYVISENIGKSKLFNIDLSNNSIRGVLPEAHVSNMSDIQRMDLSSCNLGPQFPKWVQNLESLTQLNIANNRISDTIPIDFWNTWPIQFTYLNLSSNNISGEIPDLLLRFGPNQLSIIDINSNNFYGSIPNVPSTSTYLDLSRNKFHGDISFLCQIGDGYLQYLDLSHNSFTGRLPDCLGHFIELKVLNLGYNNLCGRLPTSVESLFRLEVLSLYNNTFYGELPSSFKNCTELTFLDLGANMFTGNVPVWIGETLSRLYVLSLTSNKFLGSIPSQLCQLSDLQFLDLSVNNLSGNIPSCMNNFTAMVQGGISHAQNRHKTSISESIFGGGGKLYFAPDYVDRAMINWQGNVLEFNTNLGFLKAIDLSSNNLTGQIPNELTVLHGLVALNLSKNALLGKIPQKVGELKNLLALDLSRNYIFGGIPSSMSEMFTLAYLDLSYNELSGRIPSSTQLQSFAPSSYKGNVGLCGLPLPKCPGDEDSKSPPIVGENNNVEKEIDGLWRWFFISGATGFVVTFWVVCGTLLFSRHGHRFFRFLNRLQDMVYVKVMVFFAKVQRFFCTVSYF